MKPIHKLRYFVLAILLAATIPQSAQCFYNSSTGKWLSRDPAGETGGANLSCFAHNDSINSYDKLGLIVGKVQVTSWAPVVVNPSGILGTYRRGWLFAVEWLPPDAWAGWQAPCVPCTKVVWTQDVAIGMPVNFNPDWGVADADNYGYAWVLGQNDRAGTSDRPDQHGSLLWSFFSPYEFYAKTYAICVEGRQAGTVYATVVWGFHWQRDQTPNGLGPSVGNIY